MLTQCPNPRCKLTFEVPDTRQGKNGPCPACGQVITFRSLAVIQEIAREHEKRVARAGGAASHLAALETQPPTPCAALLEDVRSLWNVGSMFRTADGAGFAPLYLCGITGCPPHKAITKTSLGAEDSVPWAHYTNTLEILPQLRARGVQIVALEKTETSVPLHTALAQSLLTPPLCLLVGNEVAGMSVESLAQADVQCHLPMRGIKGSLNVAVAFGIAAYAIRERLEATSLVPAVSRPSLPVPSV